MAIMSPDHLAIHLNQMGYHPAFPKVATVVTKATVPLAWSLLDSAGRPVAAGHSTVHGYDPASGDHVHQVDFSEHRRAGTHLRLSVDQAVSPPFEVGDQLYHPLVVDALSFFYHQRSGIEIDAALVGTAHARPAGHLGVPPNQGDLAVPYQHPGDDQPDYHDVHGGWYDAGDHGKYVVNGSFATWLLLNALERMMLRPASDLRAFADRALRIPEAGNGVPDLLDEARWELEFLLRMRVPAGRPLAGMAFHKVHDQRWTALPQRPDLDPQPRVLYPPTTAATLTLAAVTAQAARLFTPYDPAFATRCLSAARAAWRAAVAHPDLLLHAPPGTDSGGGPYHDPDLSDEFYWAAVELYLTTADDAYRNFVLASPHHPSTSVAAGFTWNATAPLGDISLAIVPSDLSETTGKAAREAVVAAADSALAAMRRQGYPVPFGEQGYLWGSNGDVTHWATYAALAADFTGERRYRDGALAALDYLLGRNALGLSFVTGYGHRPVHHQHHRFWARQYGAGWPSPPPGALAGGPNAGLQDELSRRRLAGLPPQRCYLDDAASFATNEVAINWNAGLVWLASYVEEQAAAVTDQGLLR